MENENLEIQNQEEKPEEKTTTTIKKASSRTPKKATRRKKTVKSTDESEQKNIPAKAKTSQKTMANDDIEPDESDSEVAKDEIEENGTTIEEEPIIVSKKKSKPKTLPLAEPKLIVETTEIIQKPKKSRKKIIFLIIFLLLLLGGVLIYNFFSGALNNLIDSQGDTSLYEQLQLLITDNNKPLDGEAEDQVNILLLGMGGAQHDGGLLTDTIMIASIKPSTNQVAFISLPRDLAVIIKNAKTGALEGRKINYAYELGGMDLVKEKINDVTGLYINYYLLLDFAGFIKMINDIGGVTVDVPNRFNGYYHIADCGGTCDGADGGPVLYSTGDGPYCIYRFYKGGAEMTGEQALMFARIRKIAYSAPDSEYYEGSDFARARRQQKIIEAFQKKMFATSTLANPVKITKIISDLGNHLKTNLELWEMAKLGLMAENFNRDNIINLVIDENSGLLTGGYNYTLTPVIGDYKFSEIQKVVSNVFAQAIDDKAEETTKQKTAMEKANIMVLNGTKIEGLAGRTSQTLQDAGYTINSVANAPTAISKTTAIYDLTQSNPQTNLKLAEKYHVTISEPQDLETDYPDNEIDTSDIDFIIVLGQDQDDTSSNN
ncbi:MAG: LCP family protein [Patescibacteria group bacterium]